LFLHDVCLHRLKNKDVFEIILKHNLFTAINDKIVMLMEFDKTTAVQMLLDNRDKIPVCARHSYTSDNCF